MPIYEYECTECGNREEVIQKISDKPLTTCSKCSGKLNKLISHSTFHLKGGGWYVTDYANGKSAASNTSSSPAGGGLETSADSSSGTSSKGSDE